MKRERVTDFGEFFRSLGRPSREYVDYEDGESKDIILGDIDSKIFKEAFRNIGELEANFEKKPSEEKKRRRVNEAQINMANKQVYTQKIVQNTERANEQSQDNERVH